MSDQPTETETEDLEPQEPTAPVEPEPTPEPEHEDAAPDPTPVDSVEEATGPEPVAPGATDASPTEISSDPEEHRFRLVHQFHNAGQEQPHSVITTAAQDAESVLAALVKAAPELAKLIPALAAYL